MAELITDLTDEDIRIEWLRTGSELAEVDDDGTDTGDGVDADDTSDDDGTDADDADDEPQL